MITDQHAVDLSHCIQEQHNIGTNTYFNICDGAMHAISWGAVDWIMAITATLLVGAALGVFAVLIWAIVSE